MNIFKLFGTIAVNNAQANQAIDDTTNKGENSKGKLSGAFSAIGSAAKKLGTVAVSGLGVASAAVVSLTKKAVEAYAEYEQLVGGIETLFENSSDKVLKYSQNAYKTAGLSANDYMETVTSFSASLLQSLENDTDAAAEKADLAITDMADNANKMGTSMESIQYAYQGFAKQNFTMLDNLKLGYGGCQEEMQRLLSDAEKLSGQEFDLSSYADIVDAIHIIQTEMGITGTTAKEASTTIQGSVSSMKASWQNLMVGMADDSQDFDVLVNNFVDSVMTVGNNLIPRIQITIQGIANLITGLAQKLAPQIIGMIPSLVESVLPEIVNAATVLVDSVLQILPSMIDALAAVIPQVITAIVSLIPQLITVGVQLVVSLLNGITQALPQILVAVVELIPAIIDALLGAAPDLLNAAIQLLLAIVEAIPEVVNALVAALPQIISTIVTTLLTAIPQLIQGAVQLLMALCDAIPQILPPLIAALPQIISALITGLISGDSALLNGALQLLNAIIDAIPLMLDQLIPQLPAIVTTIVSTLVSNLPTLISGALKLFLGLVTGLVKMIPSLVAALPKIVNALITGLTAPVKGLFQGLWDGIKNIFSPIVTWFSNKFNEVKEKILAPINNAKEKLSEIFINIKTNLSEKIESLKTTVSSKFDSIKDKILTPIEKARDKIKEIIDKIKGFFSGMKLSFPNIKLPHFKVTPSGWEIGDLLKGSIPKLGIDWYDKAMDDGMIMNQPTIFGINAKGQPMAGGESGSETIVGTQSLMNMIDHAVAQSNNNLYVALEKILQVLNHIDQSMYDRMVAALQTMGIDFDERELARLVKKYA